MNVFLTSINTLIPLGLVVVILMTILWILYTRNKQEYAKLMTEKNKFYSFKKAMQELISNPSEDPRKDFEAINKIVRNFFKEYFNLSFNLTYLESKDYFKKQNKEDYAKFCKLMSDIDYSGKAMTKEDIKQIVYVFYSLLEKF